MGPQTPTEVVAMASLDGWTPLPSLPRWLCCVGFAGGLEFGFDTRGGVCRVPPTPVTSEGGPTHPPACLDIDPWLELSTSHRSIAGLWKEMAAVDREPCRRHFVSTPTPTIQAGGSDRTRTPATAIAVPPVCSGLGG